MQKYMDTIETLCLSQFKLSLAITVCILKKLRYGELRHICHYQDLL